MQKNQIKPAIYQELLDSAKNAGAKGQAQYFTPPDFARPFAAHLPGARPLIVDLASGAGDLLHACRNATTELLLGCEIDSSQSIKPAEGLPRRSSESEGGSTKIRAHQITADLTRLYPLLTEANFEADLFVLNLPWDCHWYRDRLAGLADSSLPAVREAFAAHDGRTSRDTIDSTVAGLMIALDRLTIYGEGLLIANDSTLQRLVFAPHAPHRALARHVWAYVTTPSPWAKPGALDAPALRSLGEGGPPVGVLYFAPAHLHGQLDPGGPVSRHHRRGATITGLYARCQDTLEKWTAVSQEWSERIAAVPKPAFNLWLAAERSESRRSSETGGGTVQTALSLFQKHSNRTDKAMAQELHSLNGRSPMQLVMQRHDRKTLERAAFNSPWTVCPKLQAAVKEAVQAYHACRAPLYPLPTIQRLGYLDEQDKILCVQSFGGMTESNPRSHPFVAGQRYPITSRTVLVTRHGTRPNFSGESESIEYSGQELAIYLTGDDGEECFMEARHQAEGVLVNVALPPSGRTRGPAAGQPVRVRHTVDQLIAHFEIPEVADVASVAPDAFAKNLALLAELETLMTL